MESIIWGQAREEIISTFQHLNLKYLYFLAILNLENTSFLSENGGELILLSQWNCSSRNIVGVRVPGLCKLVIKHNYERQVSFWDTSLNDEVAAFNRIVDNIRELQGAAPTVRLSLASWRL